jgi:AraC-like DNA-binding protein
MVNSSKNNSSHIQQFAFKQGLTQEFEIADLCELYKNSHSLLTVPHRTEFYHILWCLENESIHQIDFSPVATKPGSVIFIHKDMVKQFNDKNTGKGKMILFTDTFFSTQQQHIQFLNTTALFNDFFRVAQIDNTNENITTILRQIEHEYSQIFDHHKPVILQNLLHNLLMQCEREYRKNHMQIITHGIELNTLVSFKHLLEKHYQKTKLVSFYASMLNITEKKLAQYTLKTVGKTPKDIINQRVILEAKRLLAHTHLNIKEIGFQLGFDEPTNFVKFFKKQESILPGAFREQYI